jgi:hypothetical protein
MGKKQIKAKNVKVGDFIDPKLDLASGPCLLRVEKITGDKEDDSNSLKFVGGLRQEGKVIEELFEMAFLPEERVGLFQPQIMN